MRYYIRDRTLILRGTFRAAGTGVPGGLATVPTLLLHTGGERGAVPDPTRELEGIIHRQGLAPEYFGLLSGVQAECLCIMQYDFLDVFLSAKAVQGDPGGPVSVNMIVYSREGMTDAALLETIMTGTAAREVILHSIGRPAGGTPSDGIVVACEGEVEHGGGGIMTEIGVRLSEAVRFGVPEALARHEGRITRSRPSFFIYSRFQGDHWVEWLPEECPYYPCHFPGQRCEFCYCPFYPCGDESLGQWVKSASKNDLVWNCSTCTLLHEPEIADYLLENPEAPLAELKRKKGMHK